MRSSATIEDEGNVLAAGLFLSRVNIARVEVLEAVRAVLGSAFSPAVVAYLAQHGLRADALGFAVLIHGFVAGEASGVAAYDPAAPDMLTIEVQSGNPSGIDGRPRARITEAVRTLAASHGPVEVEWVSAGGEVTFLQMRPFQAPDAAAAGGEGAQRAAKRQADARDAAEPADADDWHWDAAHNPVPLSPAQAGLVALVDEQCKIGLRQRVVGGYLFYATDPTSETTPIGAADALRGLWEAARERLARPTPTLEQALETFVAIYQPLFGVVQPNARTARGVLAAFLRRSGFDPGPLLPKLLSGVPSAATERARRARELAAAVDPEARALALQSYLEEFGDETPHWDVAAPTWRERSNALERLLRGANIGAPVDEQSWREAAEAVRARLPEDAHEQWEVKLSAARRAAAVAEDDDALYAQLQAHVRRALLREGERLWKRGVLTEAGEVFWLPLDLVRKDARGDDRDRLRAGRDVADRGARQRRRGARQPAAARCRRHPGRGRRRHPRASRRQRRAHRAGADLSRRSRPRTRPRLQPRAGRAHAAADRAAAAVAGGDRGRDRRRPRPRRRAGARARHPDRRRRRRRLPRVTRRRSGAGRRRRGLSSSASASAPGG